MLAYVLNSLVGLQYFDRLPCSPQLFFFLALFTFRYVRLLGNLIAFLSYKPVSPSKSPKLTTKNATVIVSTVNPYSQAFADRTRTILANGPKAVIVVIGCHGKRWKDAPEGVKVYHLVGTPSKRKQICRALRLLFELAGSCVLQIINILDVTLSVLLFLLQTTRDRRADANSVSEDLRSPILIHPSHLMLLIKLE